MAKAKYRIEGEDATGAAFRSVLGNAKSTADKMSGIFRTAFAGVSFAAIVGQGRAAIEAGDNLEKFRQKAHLSAAAASTLAYAAKLSDVELDGLGKSLQKMQIFLSKAEEGTEANVQTLGALGLKIGDIKDLKADEQFELIADQVSRLKSEEDQTRAVTEVFGKAGAELLPMFQQGAAGIREAREEAEKLGLVFSEGELASLSKADDAIKRLDASWDHFAMTLTSKVAPAIAYSLDRLSGKPKEVYEQIADQEDLIEQLKYARGPTAQAQREAAQKKLNLLRQQALGQSSRDLGVMPQTSANAPKEPGGFASVAGPTKEDRELQTLTEQIQATADRFDQIIIESGEKVREEELEAMLKQIELVSDAQRQAEDELAVYRAEKANEEYERRQQFLDDLSYDLTDVLIRGGDGFEDMLKRWAADWLASDIRNMLGSFFGQNGPQQGSGGTGQGLFGWLGSLMGNGGGNGGSSNFVEGEWDWMGGGDGGGGLFSGLGKIFGFANGGRPPVGRPSIVGERGPEIFVPDSAGTVLPNIGAGTTMHVTYNIDNRGATVDAIKALPEILARNNKALKAEFAEELRRNRHRLS